MEQTVQHQKESLQEKINIMSAESMRVDEEGLKREILNYLLDEESGFEV
jgi:hypothetical protein